MDRTLIGVALVASFVGDAVLGCSPAENSTGRSAARGVPVGRVEDGVADAGAPAAYLLRWGGLSIREGNQLVDAPAEDVAVARGYPTWSDKGSLTQGARLTILCRKKRYAVGERVRVIHVVDVTVPGRGVYIMGPKQVHGEYVDGRLVTEPVPPGSDPLVPDMYDGVVLPSPALDYNYDITTYTFSEPGKHYIEWKLGSLRSNRLDLEVAAE